MTTKELIERQNWSLQQKIDHSLGAIDQFYSRSSLYPKFYQLFMDYKNNGVTYQEALEKVLQVNGLQLPNQHDYE